MKPRSITLILAFGRVVNSPLRKQGNGGKVIIFELSLGRAQAPFFNRKARIYTYNAGLNDRHRV
jgi:hypothetical protein